MEVCGCHCRDKSYLRDVTPCSVVEIYQRFGGKYCFLRQGRNLIRAAKKGMMGWTGEKVLLCKRLSGVRWVHRWKEPKYLVKKKREMCWWVKETR
jgi:hypothetical protein